MNTDAVWVGKPQLILCDIEGTTTSITFVKDVLFPYVREHLCEYLCTTWTSSQTREDIACLWAQYSLDCQTAKTETTDPQFPVGLSDFRYSSEEQTSASTANNEATIIEAISSYVFWAMDRDRKTTALKQLQGNIWRSGYQGGALKAHVYDEVPAKFRQWTEVEQIRLAIYSSGSVLAQKLLFAHTLAGDLTKYISAYFDTKVGAKQERPARTAASAILFLTDIAGEARAATEAGMTAILLTRDGQQQHQPFQSVNNFEQIRFLQH
ncbi:Enolase-phosphatase E1 [Tyrophagus putrescentiae]|nr:Enolase-phosphatase E1 [Tyrophagus putrescentiae]